LENPVNANELAKRCKENLGCKAVRYFNSGEQISRVAVCSGSGGSLLNDAISKNCQAFITGDIKHDVFIDAYNKGFTLIDAGHFYTENIFFDDLKDKLLEKISDLQIVVAGSSKDFFSYEI
ncbi:MAG: Nif3-like dinuclear metal center hexameric protein, partial [Hominimerdicola sp.]